MNNPSYDVIVVGAGNTALCAAMSAQDHRVQEGGATERLHRASECDHHLSKGRATGAPLN